MDKKIGFFGGKFLPLHNGHIYSILFSAQRCDELHVFLFYNTEGEQEKINNSAFNKKFLDPKVRELILKTEFEGYDNIKIHTIDSSVCFNKALENGTRSWDMESREVIEIVGSEPDIIFTSEKTYENDFKRSYPNSEIVYVDPDRAIINISATQIREKGEFKSWNFLPKSYKLLCAKSVVFIGKDEDKKKMITDLNKIYQTTCIDMHNMSSQFLKNEILKARMNANRIFFVNADENNINEFYNFYSEQNLIIYLQSNSHEYQEQLKMLKYERFEGQYADQFIRTFHLLKTYFNIC